jgi:hypothetical protein
VGTSTAAFLLEMRSARSACRRSMVSTMGLDGTGRVQCPVKADLTGNSDAYAYVAGLQITFEGVLFG